MIQLFCAQELMGQCLLTCTIISSYSNKFPTYFPDLSPLKACLSLSLYLLSCFLLTGNKTDSEILIPLIRKEDHDDKFPGSLAKVLVDGPKLI